MLVKPEVERPVGRPRLRWMDNIEMDHEEIVCVCVDWIGQDQGWVKWLGFANAVLNLRLPLMAGELCCWCTGGDLSNSAQIYRVRY
jgi:hypothetical protein